MQAKQFPYLWLAVLGAVFFIPFLGASHLFDWDEINFAESAREMLLTGNYATVQINYQPFWEKPPLFFWMQVAAMKCFDVFNPQSGFSPEFAARFPNAIIGIITLLVFYRLGKKLYNHTFGVLWALGYLGAFAPHLYFKTGIIDPTFNLFIFLGVWYLNQSLAITGKFMPPTKRRYALWAGFFVGLAILTKGPVGGLLWGLTYLTYWGMHRFSKNFFLETYQAVLIAIAVAFLLACVWFGLSIYENGWGLFADFIQYQIRLLTTGDAGHEQPFYYHFLVVLLGCFPISVLAIRGLLPTTDVYIEHASGERFKKWMMYLFWVVMILFTIVKTKIVHYSSMAWFPVSYLAAYHLYKLKEGQWTWSKWLSVGLLLIGVLMGIVLAAVPIVGQHAGDLTPYIKDPFAVGNLQAKVAWLGWEQYIGVLYLLGVIGLVIAKKIKELYLLTACVLFAYTAIVVPKIEAYTQRAALSFYESLKGQDVYVEPVGFKSYAQLFYFQKTPQQARSADELLTLPKLDKPAYFVMKITADSATKANPNLTLIKEENGFLFFKRK